MGRPQSVGSVTELLDLEFQRSQSIERIAAYRGHASIEFRNKPTIYRSNALERNEEKLLSEITTRSPDDFSSDRFTFDYLVRARHYGLPTRLLDVSLNPLTALFFACQPEERTRGKTKEPADGELIRIDVSRKREKFFDSDAISLVSNLARLRYTEKEKIQSLYRSDGKVVPSTKIKKDDLRKKPEIKRLVQFVRLEKPFFENAINPSDLWSFFLVHPKNSNRRLIAQSGAFIVSGLIKALGDDASPAFVVEKIRIPSEKKESILIELEKLNINAGTLFPELDQASTYLKNKYEKITHPSSAR